jgi:hypothetical protein
MSSSFQSTSNNNLINSKLNTIININEKNNYSLKKKEEQQIQINFNEEEINKRKKLLNGNKVYLKKK